MTRCRRQFGFTLMEVLLAVALAIGLVGGVLTFYKYASDARAGIMQHVELVDAQRAVMQQVTGELRSALAYRFLSLGLEGDGSSMQFPCTQVPGPAAWALWQSSDVPVAPQTDIHIVGYSLSIGTDEAGNTVVYGLVRSEQSNVTAASVTEGQEVHSTLLTDRIKFLYLRYFDGSGWQDSWTGGDLPAAVEISLGEQPLPEGLEAANYPYPLFRRVIALPGGAIGPSTATTIRGLGGG